MVVVQYILSIRFCKSPLYYESADAARVLTGDIYVQVDCKDIH